MREKTKLKDNIMKLRLLTFLISKLIGVDEEAEKADMHLPIKIAAFGLALLIGGFICIATFIANHEWGLLIGAAICFLLGIAAILCYKNQRIYVLSDEEFQYSTFLGNKTVYRFNEIVSLRPNNDSITLFVGGGKVHIESSAILSERFMSLVNAALEKNTSLRSD